MKTKKVKQSITIDVANLEKALKWHLSLNGALKKIQRMDKIDSRMGYQDIKNHIVDLRLELSNLDTTLFEFQEIYEALAERKQEAAAPVIESLNEQVQDLQEQIDNRLIKNLQHSLDSRD